MSSSSPSSLSSSVSPPQQHHHNDDDNDNDNDVVPHIYAQSTLENERLISLLSPVLMRSIRPEFYTAIRQRFPSTLETKHMYTGTTRHQRKQSSPVAAAVLIVIQQQPKTMGNEGNEVTNLSQLLQSATRGTRVFFIPISVDEPPSSSSSSSSSTTKEKRSSVSAIAQVLFLLDRMDQKVPLFLVAVGGNCRPAKKLPR